MCSPSRIIPFSPARIVQVVGLRLKKDYLNVEMEKERPQSLWRDRAQQGSTPDALLLRVEMVQAEIRK